MTQEQQHGANRAKGLIGKRVLALFSDGHERTGSVVQADQWFVCVEDEKPQPGIPPLRLWTVASMCKPLSS